MPFLIRFLRPLATTMSAALEQQHLELPPPLQPWQPASSYEAAHEYATQVWIETLHKQTEFVLPKMYNFIIKLLQEKEKESGESFPEELLQNWVLQLQADEAQLNAAFQATSTTRHSIQEAYTKSREYLSLHACMPYFSIDPTEPRARLELQKRFDVGREAIFMSSSADIQRPFAPFPDGRRFYETMPGFPTGYFVVQELQELLTNSDTMLVDKAWVPKEIANFVGVRINGHFETKRHWDLFQSFLGYQRIEDVFPSTWESIKSAQPFIHQPHGPFDPANPPMSGVVGPSNPYGRTQPYKPTPQQISHPKDLPYRLDRGNPPPGVRDETWASVYKSADTHLWQLYQKGKGRESKISRTERKEGRTRDRAISRLIERKVLPQGFVDLDV